MELSGEMIAKSHPEKPERLLGLEASKLSLSSICSLVSYPKLKSINISTNLIETLENKGIEKLKDLKELDVSCNSLSNSNGLTNPGLLKLNISFNRIEGLEGLSKVLPKQILQTIRAEGNLICSMKPLSGFFSLKVLDLSSNLIEFISGIENVQLEELYLNHNKISQILPGELPGTLKILQLRGNLLTNLQFLNKTSTLESLNLELNQLETLESMPKLFFLTELLLSKNKIFLLGFPAEIHEMLPVLELLDLSYNSLYDRFELLSLSKITSLFELDLEGNPCSERPDFIDLASKDYPKLLVLNSIQINRNIELDSRPASRAKVISTFDETRAKKEVKDISDLVTNKRKDYLKVIKSIEHNMEKQFYDEFSLLKGRQLKDQDLFTVKEEIEEKEHEDLEEQEQHWFNTQMEWTRKLVERKGATHRYIKDDRPASSRGNISNNTPSTAKGVNRQRKKLEEAIRFTKNK